MGILLFWGIFGGLMDIRLVKRNESVVYERNTEKNLTIAKQKALQIPSGSVVLFEMLVDLSISEGITCGDCYGFQCSNCWRGVIVVYATLNKPFFDWLYRHKERTGVEHILKGITQISNIK